MKTATLLTAFLLVTPVFAVPILSRGPYLQKANPGSVIVRWKTDVPATGTVRYGVDANNLTQSASEASATTDHSVLLSGLTASTKVFYSVESDGTVLSTTSDCFFNTPPSTGAATPIRFWAVGDSGTANINALAVRNAYTSLVHSSTFPAQFMMMLGDNAYPAGSDESYQAAVFNTYTTLLRQLPVWTTIGNHETYSVGGGLNMPHLAIFDLPTAGECGGVASGTEYYYSFDHGNVHFVCIDSMVSSRAANGAMALWLQADLQANAQPWTVAFFHHPPYTKGSHDSDYETELIEMRTNILPILESYGVDLVLSGHSHCYERSYLLDGHYGSSGSLAPSNLKNSGSGNPLTTGAYRKPTAAMAPREGAVYIVNGSSGQVSGGALNHPAMFLSLNNLGSLVVDVEGNRMDVRFLRETGAVDDYFAIIKGTTIPETPSGLSSLATGTNTVQLFWNDNSANEQDFVLYGSLNGVNFSEIGSVAPDSFNVTVSGLSPETTYYFTLFSRNQAGSSGNSNITSVTTPAVSPILTTMEMWRFNHFGTTAVTSATGETADADGDGHMNLIEYALGSMPNRIGSVPLLPLSFSNLGELEITFQRQALPELTYVVESKTDLALPSWTPLYTSSGAENTAGPVKVKATQLPSFVRLRIVR